MIFDTHAHYDDAQFDADREELLLSLSDHHIGKVVNIGTNVSTSQRSVELAEKYPFVFAAVGIHPSDTREMAQGDLRRIADLAKADRVVAIGEIGLDYYWDKEEQVRSRQKECLIEQLEIARKAGLPVVIHSRDAAKDTLDIMKEYGRDLGGVIHCYSYSVEIAREYVKMGYFLGIGGVLTYKNSKTIKEVAAQIPLEHLVLETDCPYLTPAPHRGKRNCSLYLPYVVQALSEIKGLPVEEVERVTWENAHRLYHLSY